MVTELRESKIAAGVRAGLPLVLPTFALGASFGVLAREAERRRRSGTMSNACAESSSARLHVGESVEEGACGLDR